MKPLNLVLVMVDPPIPFGNAAARWYYVLFKGLVERGHRVTVFAAYAKESDRIEAMERFPADTYDLRLYPLLPRNGWRDKWETFIRPFSFLFSPVFRNDLRARLAEGFDILHLEHLWAGWFCLGEKRRTLVNVQYLFEIDLEASPPRTWTDRKNRFLSFSAERRLLKAFHWFRTCTPRLAPPILKLNPTADITSIPLGLDTRFYEYIRDDRRGTEPVVTVIGAMNWIPSLSSAVRLLDRLWPSIKERVPAAKLQIVGWNARSALKEYLGLPDVAILENVPETRPYFEAASVFVYAPSRGSGMKIKIQEAMAYGVPIVTTSEGVEGIPAIDGVHVGLAEDDQGLIDRAVDLLNDVDLQNRRRVAARALIESVCGPQVTLDAQEAVYRRMIASLEGK